MINHGAVVFDDSVTSLKQHYLARKRVDLKLLEPTHFEPTPGVAVVQHEDFALVLEVDTRQQSIETLIARLMSSTRVADISIEDPPLEEVIAALYREPPSL